MSNNRNDYPSGYGYGSNGYGYGSNGYGYGSNGYGYGSNDYGNGSTNGNTNGSYTAADAMNYMASRAPANQSRYGPNRFSGPTYGDNYGLGSAAAQGFGNGSRPNRTTWEYGPVYPDTPSADALRGAADMMATAERRRRTQNGHIPGGDSSGPNARASAGWHGGPGAVGPIPLGPGSWGLLGTGAGQPGAANGYQGNDHGNGNAWGHGGFKGNTWGHGGNGNGGSPYF
ncbi:hypothetical protein EsH8_X_000584 [Colletotrichum jinshuiense]